MVRSASALALVAAAAALAPASPASAAGGSWWHLDVGARPSVLAPGSEGEIVLSAENVGEGVADGPITLADVLPSGVRATGISGSEPKRGGALGETVALSCSLAQLSCEAAGRIAPYDAIEVRIEVQVLAGAQSGEADTLSVSGGGAPSAQIARPVAIGSASVFGVEGYELSAEGEGGGSVTQAGAHPFQVTGSILLNQGPDAAPLTSQPSAAAAAPARDVVVRLPPGLIANPSAVPRCLSWQLAESVGGAEQDRCPYQSAVGVASVTFDQPGGLGTRTVATPIFNVEPEAGEPARFGFFVPIEGVPVNLTTSVRSSEDWGVDISSAEIPDNAGISSVRVTFWGVAGSATHDNARGWGCLAEARGRSDIYEACTHFEEQEPPAFVTLPTSCTSSLSSSLQADSWEAPGAYVSLLASEPLQALSGCANVPFSPTISTTTTTASASSPSGFSFDLSFAREGLTSGTGIAQSNLEDTVASLPEGLTIDPSAGVGLGACTEAQYAQEALGSPPGAGCPEDSKLGTVEVETPLLFTTVYGTLYLAQPYENPFKSLIALYVVARSRAERGIIVKLAGRVSADPATGRLTVSFEGDPPLQFERFNFHFREGAQAPLITPATCGSYTTTAQLTPYSAPESSLTDTASFQVTSGSEGSACPNGLPPFAPSIKAGTLDSQAGVFSPFYVELARTDAMSEISTFSASLPQGLTANLSGVPFCSETDIERARTKTGAQEQAEPSCPSASLIGHTLVGTGVGAVLDYVPGRLYMSGPFHGDPLSVVSITSAVVGPFDLGTIVIRFALHIDPYTARVSIDPTGSEPIPTIIDGIVTHVRNIRVSIDRPDFTLNPTACQPAPTASTLTSPQAQTATITTPFAPNDCDELKFQTQVHRLRRRAHQPHRRSQPLSEAHQPDQARLRGQHQDRPRRTPRATPLTLADPAESVHRNAVQRQPGRLPTGVDDWACHRDHADHPRTAQRPRDLRQPRRRRLAQPRARAPGLRRHNRPRWHDSHQPPRGHQHHLPSGARRAGPELPDDAPQRPLLRPHRPRKPLPSHHYLDSQAARHSQTRAHPPPHPPRQTDPASDTHHAHHLHRTKRRDRTAEHEDLGHRLPEGEEARAQEEGQGRKKGQDGRRGEAEAEIGVKCGGFLGHSWRMYGARRRERRCRALRRWS